MPEAWLPELSDSPLYYEHEEPIAQRLALVQLAEWERAEVCVPEPFQAALKRRTLRRYDFRIQVAARVGWPPKKGDMTAMGKVLLDLTIAEIAKNPQDLPTGAFDARQVVLDVLYDVSEDYYQPIVKCLGWSNSFHVKGLYEEIHDVARRNIAHRLAPIIQRMSGWLDSATRVA